MQNKIAAKFQNFVLLLILLAALFCYNNSFAVEELPEEESDSASFTSKATIQTLNKITARTETLELTVDKEMSFGKLDIILHKCWKSPSYQAPENKMLIEVFNNSHKTKQRIFYGWIFSSSPSISGLEHPIYDITAIKCF